MKDTKRKDDDKDERGHDLRFIDVVQKPTETAQSPVSVDAYSLASQRRVIAYGRARGRS